MLLKRVFQPRAVLSEQETARGQRFSILQAAAGAGLEGVTSGGFLAAFALALGASNLQIGVLTALPFIAQVFQIPGILLVERLRRRKVVAVTAYLLAQSLWIPVALIPLLIQVPSGGAVSAMLGLLALRGVANAFINSSLFSWLRSLIPQPELGRFFSRRQAAATASTAVVALGAALFLEEWKGRVATDQMVYGYTLALVLGTVALGGAGVGSLALVPEPQMEAPAGPRPSFHQMLATPWRDRNFRKLITFLFSWNFATHLAMPFFAVYMLQGLGIPLPVVIGLSVLSQLLTLWFAQVWGPLVDKFGGKVVLSLCASLFLLVILGWTLVGRPEAHALTLPLLVVLHSFAGIATSGISLTDMTLRMKLAPAELASAYLSGASLAISLGAGLAPLLGGFLADFFQVRDLGLSLHWTDPARSIDLPVLRVAGFDFLFLLAFVLGLLALNLLTTVREEGEVDRQVVLDQLMAGVREGFRAVSSVPGVGAVAQVPYNFLRRVPGLDVVLGVTAYQVGSSVERAVAAATHGADMVDDLAQRVSQALTDLVEDAEELQDSGSDLARYAVRGVLAPLGDVTGDVGHLAKGVVLGVLNALTRTSTDMDKAVTSTVYGAVLGAGEMGADVLQAALHSIAAAREAAHRLGIGQEEAEARAIQAALEAAETVDPQAAERLRETLQKPRPEDGA